MSRGRCGSNAGGKDFIPALNLNATNLNIEELWLTFTQKEVTVKAATSTIVALEKLVECCGTENAFAFLMQRNEELHQLSWLLQKIASGAQKSLIDSVPNKFNGIDVKVEDAFYRWCEKDVSELPIYEKHI